MTIELRSDTLSKPTQEMIKAMASAKVGDDTVERDPTVVELEEKAANLFGKEACLLAVSGTMANQLAVMALCDRGDEIIVGSESHIYNLEVSALSALSQVQARPVVVENKKYPVEEIQRLFERRGIQAPKTSLLCLENSNNLNEGNILDIFNVEEISKIAHSFGASVLTDGARILNVSVETGIKPSDLVKDSDAVMLTLTKGLCAPFGAVLAGNKDFIEKARWLKQRLGGGFRQAGYMAAPAIVALDTMVERLKEDNDRAKQLAMGIKNSSNLKVMNTVDTNIVRILLDEGLKNSEFESILIENRINLKKIGRREYRAVLHAGITDEILAKVISVLGRI